MLFIIVMFMFYDDEYWYRPAHKIDTGPFEISLTNFISYSQKILKCIGKMKSLCHFDWRKFLFYCHGVLFCLCHHIYAYSIPNVAMKMSSFYLAIKQKCFIL